MSNSCAVLLTYEDTDERVFSKNQIRRALETICELEHIDVPCEVSCMIVSKTCMRAYNAKLRGIESATDVVSVECERPSEFDGVSPVSLGDIIVCPEVVKEEMSTQEMPFEQGMYRMFIHGIYHLLGYDHMNCEEAKIMEEKEEAAFRKVLLHI